MSYIIKGDKVLVIAGNHKGLTGEVLKNDGKRIVVQGINVRKKHTKPTQENPKGAIIQIECPINLSNVSLCVDGKPAKLYTKVDGNGSKALYYKEGDKETCHRTLKKGQK